MSATSHTNTTTPRTQLPANNSLRERLLRRINLVIIALAIGFTSISIVGLANTTVNITNSTHESTLSLTKANLSQTIEAYVADTIALSTDVAFKDYILGLERSLVLATGVGRELIRQNVDTYLGIRYINREGNVQVSINNQAGTPLPIAFANGRPAPEVFESQAFQSIINGETAQVTLGAIDLLRDRDGVPVTPPRLTMTFYSAVLLGTNNSLPGVIELRIDATNLLGDVNNADLTLFEPIPDRRLILINDAGLVIADSAQPNNNYLLNIQAIDGNIDNLPVYRTVYEFGQTNTEPAILTSVGSNLVSDDFIDITGVDDVRWGLYFIDDIGSLLRPSIISVLAILIFSGGIVTLGLWVIRRSLASLMEPVETADNLVRRIAEGDIVSGDQPSSGRDDDLVGVVQQINTRVNTLSKQLQEQTIRRNRDMQVAGRIGREMATQTDLESLVNRAINLICNQLGFYHAQVFLIDDLQQYAVLSFSRGETGRDLLERGHRLKIGSKTIIGQATSRREPVYVNNAGDTVGEAVHGFNPALPDTRSEMGLPLVIGDDLIGVLDLQSKNAGAFLTEDIPTYQLLADQLAIAIYNARLKEQTAQRISQIDQLNRQLTRQAWQETNDTENIAKHYGDIDRSQNGKAHSAPISIRNEVIGNLVASDEAGEMNEGDQMILQAVAERVSLAIENARLFQETQSTLAETSVLYQLSRQLNEADTLNDITQAIVKTVALDASGAQVWLFDESITDERVAKMATDLHLHERAEAEGIILVGQTLRHHEHPFLQALTGTSVHVSADLNQEDEIRGDLRQLITDLHAQSLVIIPIVMRGVWKGYITLEFAEPRRFSERERRVYEALITQAGVAIDNRLLLQQTEAALARNEKLYTASRIVNTAQTLSDLVYAAVVTADSPSLEFWLSMPEGNLIEDSQNAYEWLSHARIVARSEEENIIESDELYELTITPRSRLNNREPEILAFSDENDNLTTHQAWIKNMGYRFMAMFPLFSENTPIAFLTLVSKKPFELSSDDYEIYRALTGQMATQIENRRLLQRTEEALNETRRLYVVNRLITDADDIDSIFDAIVGQLAMHFLMRGGQINTISLTILQPYPTPSVDAPQLEVVYQWLSNMDVDPKFPVGTYLDHQTYPLAKMIVDTDAGWIRIPDIRQDLGEYAPAEELLQQGDTTNAVVVSAFQSRGNLYGVLILRSSDATLFDDSYMRFLTSVSDQVAIVIERQRLLSEAENERANLNSLLSTLPTGVLVLDFETRIPIRYNDRMIELLNQDIDMTRPFDHLDYNIGRTGTHTAYPTEDLPINLAFQSLTQHFADDLVISTPDYLVNLLVNVVPVVDHQGKPTAIIAAFEDISTLRAMEDTLQENLREQVTLYETQRALIEATNIEEQLDSLIGQLIMQDASDALIVISDINTEALHIARQQNEMRVDLQDIESLLQTKMVHIRHSARANDDTRRVMEKLGMNSALILPLKARNRTQPLGWLVLLDEQKSAFSEDQERTLTSIADMATTSLDNNYLFQTTEESLAETEQLYQSTTAISRTTSLADLGQAAYEALAYLDPDFVAIGLLPTLEMENTLYIVHENWEAAEAGGFNLDDLLLMPLPDASDVYLSNIAESAGDPFSDHIAKAGIIHAFAAVNLRIKDEQGGRIFIAYKEPRRFTDADKRFLNTVADSTSIMVDYQILLSQLRNTLQETSTLYQASRALLEISTPEEVIEVIVEQLIEPHINQVFFASLRTPRWDTPGVTVDIKASWQSESNIDLLGVTLSPDQFPAWTQLASREVLVINDIYAEDSGLDTFEQASIESLDTRSLVVIPLRVPNREIGSIWLGSREPYEYNDAAIRIFQRFGEQTSLTLETSYLIEQTERRARQLETSAQINQRVGTILDLDVLLPEVVDLIKDQFGYDHVQIFLMDDRDDYAELRASTGTAGEQLMAIRHKLQKGSDSVIGRVTAEAKPTIALDTADANVIHQPNAYLPMTRSEMALPLIIKGKVVGALDVQSNVPNAFIEEDITALNVLASQIAIGVDNARLYADSENRANEMSFLFDIIATAAAADSLEEALELIAQRITEDLNALAVAIYLPITYSNAKGVTFQRMKASALSGDTQAIDDIPEIKVNDAENLIGLVSSTMQAQIINQIEKEIRYQSLSESAQSAIITPITSANTIIGLITMESARSNAFNNETLTLMLTLAGSLSAVIQNALLLEKVQETNERLREIDRIKTQFLANMSHELRTPLNSIIGFSRVMLKGIDGPLTKMQEQDLSTIFTSGNHLLHLINDILDQAKIEANQLTLKQSFFDIKAVVEGAKSMALGLLKDKPNLTFDVEVAPNLPEAYGDEFRSRQILINLVSNAIKFTMEGGVQLRVYAAHSKAGDIVLQLDVTDTGLGIREEDIPTIFEQFRQVDSSLTRTAGGTGLGLPISKSLAELQGGTLTVKSEVNVGSTFSITIPTEANEATENGDEDDTKPTLDASDTAIMKRDDVQKAMRATQNLKSLPTKREVLLIEDNKDMVDQFRRVLQREGFEVQTADHPSFAQAMASNLRPNVIIMDVNFAEGEGWKILESLKERDDTFDIPVIVNTISGESERAYRLGAHTFMQRPFAPEDLITAVLSAEKESNRERILIIDDQPESIRLLMQLLSEHGDYRVFSAENGEDGISLVARRHPDLIILDLRMPNMDGFAVLNELRSNPETAKIPVMVVTGEIDFNDDEQSQLQNIHILHKGDIDDATYQAFIEDVRKHLSNEG